MMICDELFAVAARTDYPFDAFVFVQRGLEFTVSRCHGEVDDERIEDDDYFRSRHITGEMLCRGLRDFARDQYGLMARAVLERWHITRTEDFGHIVFAMVDAGLMQKTPDDDLTDFARVFDFSHAFAGEFSLA